MHLTKQRVLITLMATAVVAASGAVCGALLGRFQAITQAARRVSQGAISAEVETEPRLLELRAALEAMQSTTYSPCSNAELTYFRALIYDAKYLKDIGRMGDGGVECSASLGRPQQPLMQDKKYLAVGENVKIYKDLALYHSEDQMVVAIRWGDFFAVYTPYVQAHLKPGYEHYSETLVDSNSNQVDWLFGDPPPVSAELLTKNGFAHAGDILYATRCSSEFSNCVTAYLSVPEALQANQLQMRIYVTVGGMVGGMVGGLLGFFSVVFYRRYHNMEQQLRRAIRMDKLRVAYQPVVDLENKRIVGAEALARWRDEEGREVGPDTFIKIAEDGGFVNEITKLVLRHVLRDFGATLRARPEFRVNINVTATDLADPAFPAMLNNALSGAGVPSTSVGIEITESSTARRKMAMEAIAQLRKTGHSVYVDDFGTGYSSLAYLHDLAVDVIKIDKAFTQSIGSGGMTASVLPQILAMAESFQLKVVAEGIETGQQASYFADSEHHVLAQGWLFGHPVQADDFMIQLAKDDQAESAPPDAA